VRAVLAAAWPWCLATALAVWFALLPGTVVFELFVGLGESADTVVVLTAGAFALLLSVVTASARDGRRVLAVARPIPAQQRPRSVASGQQVAPGDDPRHPAVVDHRNRPHPEGLHPVRHDGRSPTTPGR
jgi:hypothetical protein